METRYKYESLARWLYCSMTLLSDVDGNILEDVSLLQYPAVLHEDPVHEVVTLDPREGCCEVQVLCLRNVLGKTYIVIVKRRQSDIAKL